MGKISIIDATDTHLPGITTIFNHAVRNTFSIWSETETTVDLRRGWMTARRQAGFPVLVAVDVDAPDTALGYGSFGVFRDFPGYVKTVEHSVYVAAEAQRRGIGAAILDALMMRARAMGMETMVGAVDSANAASIALHEKAGFELQGTLKGVGRKFGKRLDLAFLVKAL